MKPIIPPWRRDDYNPGMRDERKNSSVAIWAAVSLIAVPILYELSVGPLVGMLDRKMIPERLQPAVDVYFIPTNYVYDRAPEPVQRVMHGYVRIFVRDFPRRL